MLPIVLAHGIARFDILSVRLREKLKLPDNDFNDKFQYFKGIRTHLREFEPIFHPNQDFAGPVAFRANQLKTRVNEALRQTGAPKVHIIGHSMGGLDARYMIVELEMADKVASLTTIGTPHLGTVLADHKINKGGNYLITFFDEVINFDINGAKDLTVTACEAFNQKAEDKEAKNDVFYQTYASFEDTNRMFTPLIKSGLFIQEHAGANDGLVPFASQQWTPELVAQDGTRKQVVQKEFPFPADHLNQCGWWDLRETPFSFRDFFASVKNLFKRDIFEQKKDFEDRVKAVYLEIVTDLQQRNFN